MTSLAWTDLRDRGQTMAASTMVVWGEGINSHLWGSLVHVQSNSAPLLDNECVNKPSSVSDVNHLLSGPRRFGTLFFDPCVQRVNGQHRCTLAHSYADPPSSSVCIVSFLLRSVFRRGNSLCFLLFKRPLRSYPQPTCPRPCCE